MARLIADLDSDVFDVREKAAKEWKLGAAAEPALRKALEGRPSAEVRRRVEGLLQEEKPDVYPLGVATRSGDTDYEPVRGVLSRPAPASPADGGQCRRAR